MCTGIACIASPAHDAQEQIQLYFVKDALSCAIQWRKMMGLDHMHAADTTELAHLFEATLCRGYDRSVRIVRWSERPSVTQGYSGACVQVFDVVVVIDGVRSTVALVIKDVFLVERQVMTLLNAHHYPVIPLCYSDDLSTVDRRLMCQQWIEPDGAVQKLTATERVATQLARIHADHFARARTLPWLPRADRDYFNGDYLVRQWRAAWRLALSDDEFTATHGHQTAAMEAAVATLLRAVDMLWKDGSTLTLVHGDLHDGNILVQDGCPFLIDWEMARLGTLYLDLPNYFSPEESLLYRDALAEYGYPIPLATFQRGYRDLTRSLGILYMKYWIDAWLRGGADRERSRRAIANLIVTTLTGTPTSRSMILTGTESP